VIAGHYGYLLAYKYWNGVIELTVETNQQLHMTNLIAFRKNVRAAELHGYAEKMLAYFESHGAKKVGGSVSATYAVDGDMMDIEVYIPVDKEIPSSEEFVFKPKLYLCNCIKVNHKGNPQLLEETINKLNDYIENHNLTPISACFTVTLKEITNPSDAELFEMDAYISISPNLM